MANFIMLKFLSKFRFIYCFLKIQKQDWIIMKTWVKYLTSFVKQRLNVAEEGQKNGLTGPGSSFFFSYLLSEGKDICKSHDFDFYLLLSFKARIMLQLLTHPSQLTWVAFLPIKPLQISSLKDFSFPCFLQFWAYNIIT